MWNVKSRISSRKKLLDYIQESIAKMEAVGSSANLASLYEGRHIAELLKLQNNSFCAVSRF